MQLHTCMYTCTHKVDVNTHQSYHLEYILSEFTKYSNSFACVPKYIQQNNRIHRNQQYVCVCMEYASIFTQEVFLPTTFIHNGNSSY